MDEDETFPGQLGIGTARIDYYPRYPTDEERAAWAVEDAERDARRIPIGFHAPSNQGSLDGVAKKGKPSSRAKSSSPRRPKRV